ncbi:hypothetical protein [Parasedimentitalea psychrophila]|uniref:Uncharacterized protein n=1 Tax=Parasedimentitalea psychrophila TaxID=2997337 RepID=A0A9Y2P5M0_9RHOB|nr:hypothetical protein [Parasedimentitalea psychrophila]WIY26504.1 hypothetical protein QPJ95_06195 [Parasedimentitalea psychrophila]
MAEDDIWVSNVLNNSNLVIGTDIDREEPAWVTIGKGEKPAQADLPIRIYAMYKDQTFTKKFPDLFDGGGGTKISPPLEAIFRKFNLGSSWICPAQLFLYDRMTLVDHTFSIFAGWETLQFLVPEESEGLRGYPVTRQQPNPPPPDVWGVPWELKDGDIAIAPRDLDGLDFWYDSRLRGAVFFSDPLKQSLCDGGYCRLFKFRKCKVIAVH